MQYLLHPKRSESILQTTKAVERVGREGMRTEIR